MSSIHDFESWKTVNIDENNEDVEETESDQSQDTDVEEEYVLGEQQDEPSLSASDLSKQTARILLEYPESDRAGSASSDGYEPSGEEKSRISSNDYISDELADSKPPIENTPEDKSDQNQQDQMAPITTKYGSHRPQTDLLPQTTTKQENRQPRIEMTPQITLEQKPLQLKSNFIPSTTKCQQSHAVNSENSVRKGRNKNFCFYCETYVVNFARHIIRRHYLEVDVQKILAYPKKSKTRKSLLTDLRKKGNYASNIVRCERPMKKAKHNDDTDYLPCIKCLGFYARKQLWKHNKKCNPEHSGSRAQAEAQNFICRQSSHTPSKSLQKVFTRMRADRIAFVAKQDSLICAFGENYLKTHGEKHFINVTSRKMRELAKLLIEVRKIKSGIKTFLDILKPENYDTLIAATKCVAKYDSNTDRYSSPSYAMNISISIKQCCNLAIMKISQKEADIKSFEIQADVKSLVQLIESNWKFDVSTADDVNLVKCNKISILSIARDLKLLYDHLCSTAKSAVNKLTQDENCCVVAYNDLLETVLCRCLLLNRRRPGEIQRLLLKTYVDNDNNEYQYEEFDCTLSATENILVKHFKRIVIRRKQSSGVFVLFSKDVQHDIDLLISLRSKYIDPDNEFLFAKPSGMTSLCGYKILKKHVTLCGAKNFEAIASTKLRNHLATLTQLFNMSESDYEQLSDFMVHTAGVHRIRCKLPDDISQTAKVAKLLILMENGQIDAYKGKSFDEINLSMEEDLEGIGLTRDHILNFTETFNTEEATPQDMESVIATHILTTRAPVLETQHTSNDTSTNEPLVYLCKRTSGISSKKKRVLVPWTTEQKNIVRNYFETNIRSKKPPKRHECDALKALYPELLHNKDWLKIKVFVQNAYCKP